MITLLFGHRGAGKSTLLLRLALTHKTFDLDLEIAARTGKGPSEWIAESEAKFREVEVATLNELMREGDCIIALGAGFLGPLPTACRKVWVRRLTDASGRSFLNRPRLNQALSPIEEYRERFEVREKRYASWADEELFLPEGDIDGIEFFFAKKIAFAGDLTLLPENFRAWDSFQSKRSPQFWEVRDDLLTPEQIHLALETLPKDKILYSVRRSGASLREDVRCDWALELGAPSHKPYSLSLHERGASLADCFARLQEHDSEIKKLAVEIHSFTELLEGHHWWLQDPARRAFLPRSTDGRWRFYRSLYGARMPLHFVREGTGSSLDQPYLWQMLLQKPLVKDFAAVLGDPVEHSRSPREHRMLEIPFVSVKVKEEEFSEAIPVLRELGLRYAAVTSPLKKLAFQFADQRSREAELTFAANTLLFAEKIHAHNTDILALKRWRDEDLKDLKPVWVWGGGGLKETLEEVWPDAQRVSARKGDAPEGQPGLVIWSVGRSRDFRFPNKSVQPRMIADLNYGDDSPGLEWAVAESLPYQSGLKMFKLQAEFQREFWKAP